MASPPHGSETIRNLQNSQEAENPQELTPFIRHHFSLMLANDSADWNLSVYDLAWVLCCDYLNQGQKEHSLQVLRAVQNADGTWGDCSYMPHSALIDTLAVVMAMIRLKEPIPHADRIKVGVSNLISAASQYTRHDTVAFELLMPLLLDWIERKRFKFPLDPAARDYVNATLAKGRQKLTMIARGPGLFDPRATLSYTAEFSALITLTKDDLDQLPNLMLPNGAVGLSPAATAAVILVLRANKRDVPEKLYKYLGDVFDAYKGRGFPDLYPYAHTQRLWNIVPWILSGNIFDLMSDPEIGYQLLGMYEDLKFDDKGRVSWDTYNTNLPDLDDTSVAFALRAVLARSGIPTTYRQPISAFREFQRKDGSFFCYPHELHPSPVGILHAVMALEIATGTSDPAAIHDPEVKSLMADLLRNLDPHGQDFDMLCHDKWHASWTYGSQRWLSISSIRRAYPDTVRSMIVEILSRQRGGGWGQQDPSPEETAYVAAGLAAVLQDENFVLPDPLRSDVEAGLSRASGYLSAELAQEDFNVPLIWISKNVYVPLHQAISAILDARFSLMAAADQVEILYEEDRRSA